MGYIKNYRIKLTVALGATEGYREKLRKLLENRVIGVGVKL
jgi:hypothetical protein